jgi:hypothetical protein
MEDKEKHEDELSTQELNGVAGGTPGAGILYPGQTRTEKPSDFSQDSNLGVSGSSFKIDQPTTPPGY